jgi:predicted secreted protein
VGIRARELDDRVCGSDHLDSRAMDRRLARRNLRTALITAVIGLLMFALTFVAALLYVA